MKNPANWLPLVALCCIPAHADVIISYSDSGTFSGSTGSDAFGFSGPGDTWSFSFEADANNPGPLSDVGMGGFNFSFSDFSYTLNGVSVAITPTFIRFFSGTNGGGWEMCFNGTTVATCTDALGTPDEGWPQMYAGTTSAPTLIAGSFTTDFAAFVNSTGYEEPSSTVVAVATPEPSTLLMLTTGFLALGGRRLYRRR